MNIYGEFQEKLCTVSKLSIGGRTLPLQPLKNIGRDSPGLPIMAV